MSKLSKTISNYWKSSNTNIFNNYIDAIFGAVVLVILPAISLGTTFLVTEASWSNYTFPILAICLSGAYDSLGRYSNSSPAKAKLICRWIVEGIALFLAAFFTNSNVWYLLIIPPTILLICGLFILREVFSRINDAIVLSPWCL